MGLAFAHETLGQRVLFGAGRAAPHLAAEVERLGAVSVMVIASGRDVAMVAAVTAGIDVALRYHDTAPHVPVETAERARAAARAAGIDLVVSVGGGSTTGLAKAVALTERIPIVAVPTTYAGSEATNVWGSTEHARKSTGTDPAVLPKSIVYDVDLTLSMPVPLSVASGLNALAHGVDAMWAPRADPINQAMAVEAIRALAAGLPKINAEPGARDGREQTLYGAYLAAVAFASAGSGMHHKIAHVLGGAYNLPHAQTHAVLLPYVLAFNAPFAADAACRIAAALGGAEAVSALTALRTALDAPAALRDYGLAEADLPAAADLALAAVPDSNPRPVNRANLLRLLQDVGRHHSDRRRYTLMTSPPPADAEQRSREAELTQKVIDSFAGTADERLRTIMESLTRHLHAFIREVRLTDAEWTAAIAFLTDTGHLTDERRQEFILLSDVLGASMLTITVNNEARGDATEATVFGPFFVAGAPHFELGADISGAAEGEPCWVEGTVTDTAGNAVAGADIEVWEADEAGHYDVQYDDARVAARGHLSADDAGAFRFWALTPTPYPIPDDGPVGQLLAATGRSPVRASHLHFMVGAPGLRTLVTHIFVRGDDHLDSDSVFGVKDSLIKDFERQPAGTPAPDGRDLGDHTWCRTRFDIVLAPAGERTGPDPA